MPLENTLYYGDNLKIMRDRMPSQSVDLIYLDPPFKSDQNYNQIYRLATGRPVPDQKHAFEDAWKLDASKEKLIARMPILLQEHGVDSYYSKFWEVWIYALRNTQPELLAYLLYMVERLLWMKSILKSTGSIYLHCDPTASHYIKVMMDGIFGHRNFRNEIIWQRTGAHSDARQWGRVSDTILFYSKSDRWTWNTQYEPYSAEYIAERYKYIDEKSGERYWRNTMTAAGQGPPRMFRGKLMEPPAGTHWRYSQAKIDEMDAKGHIYYSPSGKPYVKSFLKDRKGRPVQNIWTDIVMSKSGKDRLGFPTQKPVDLMKRIIAASSNPGDIVFDPFCGCGTTVYAAEESGRTWVGCDVAILAVNLITRTLQERYKLREGVDFSVDGIPVTHEQAQRLAKKNKTHFQTWSVESVGGFPNDRVSGDRGIDGRVYFETRDGLRSMVISVKGGAIKPADVRDLRGVLEREPDCEMAGFICLKDPTDAMLREAAEAGTYLYAGNEYPRIQILTTHEIVEGKRLFNTPTRIGMTKGATGQVSLPLHGNRRTNS